MLLRATIAAGLASIALVSTAEVARAQSSPGFSNGQVPTAGQWNAAFSSKQDRLTFTPLSQAGGTMAGKFQTAPSTINGAGFAVLPGIAPTAPSNGDIWTTSAGMFARVGGQTVSVGFNQNAVTITGGTIDGTTIGGSTPAAATFTMLAANGLILSTALPIAQGGCGATTVIGCLSNLGLSGGTAGYVLTSNGPGTAPTFQTASTGSSNAVLYTAQTLTGTQQAQARANIGINSAGAVSFRNRLINGNFAINQRAASSASTSYAAGTYVMDRWKAGANGVTLSFATAANGDVTVTITAGTLLQVIEGGIYLPEGGTYEASWLGSSTCRAYQGSATSSYAASPFTVSAWTAGTNGTVECSTGTLTLAQFEPGTQTTAFERRDDELRRCVRYYRAGNFNILGNASAANGYLSQRVDFNPPMRAIPNLTVTSTSSNGVTGTYITAIGPDAALVYTQSGSGGNGQLIGTYTAEKEL